MTTDVASLAHGQARRSLLLTPTGRIRADFMVGRDDEGFLLLQHPEQAGSIGDLLLPYVLSSDVTLRDRTQELSVFGLVGHAAVVAARAGLEPSILGAGEDIVVASGKPAARERERLVASDLAEVGWDAREVWRIRRGQPRMGPDFDEGSLPSEAGLDATIDATKGCFLGQESVAKVRNLGHPPSRAATPSPHRRPSPPARSWWPTALRRRASSRARRWPRTAPARPRSSASGGRRRPPICAPPTASISSPSARWTSPFVSFPVPLPGKEGLRAFDPFRWATPLCYESSSAVGARPSRRFEGGGTSR